jgi:dienelactone hydrolase
MNYALLQRMIRVTTDSADVAGSVAVDRHETVWRFTPGVPWRAGSYRLVVDGGIEDVAGNRPGLPFDVESIEPPAAAAAPKPIAVPFRIAGEQPTSPAQIDGPERVVVRSGDVALSAMLWRPRGRGPFPAALVNHGSGRTREELQRLGPYEDMAEKIGPLFARHGYVLLFVFRHGVGPSSAMGQNAVDLMNAEMARQGLEARNALQMNLLEGREMADGLAGLTFLRALPEVDSHRIVLVGHSFGGSLTVLMAEREPAVRAAVVFSAAGYSWDRSPELRARLLAAVHRTSVPIFFIHAANDYSTNPGNALDAELARLGKPHRLRIYPPVGHTPEDGHDFPNNSIAVWEPDVFAFLNSYVK